jgi:hypothetical protein
MAATRVEEEATRPGRGRDKRLVVASLFGPGAWAVFIALNYMLEDPVACAPGASVHGQILGVGVKAIGAGISLVLGVATVVVGVLSILLWLRLRHGNSSGRPAWMALAGFLNSVLFGTIILLGVAPSFFLRTCTPTP